MSKNAPLWIATALGVGSFIAGFAFFDGPMEQLSAATRYTARVGFPLLILAYIARPLLQLTRANFAKHLVQKRREIGLGFAITHTIHLIAIALLFWNIGEWPDLVAMIGGGGAYAFLYAMALTSNQSAMKALGRRWKTLHTIGIHYLWLIFLQSYAGRIFSPEHIVEGAVFTTIALGAAGVRLVAWRKK